MWRYLPAETPSVRCIGEFRPHADDDRKSAAKPPEDRDAVRRPRGSRRWRGGRRHSAVASHPNCRSMQINRKNRLPKNAADGFCRCQCLVNVLSVRSHAGLDILGICQGSVPSCSTDMKTPVVQSRPPTRSRRRNWAQIRLDQAALDSPGSPSRSHCTSPGESVTAKASRLWLSSASKRGPISGMTRPFCART